MQACTLRLWQCLRALAPDIVHTRNLTTLEAQLPAACAGVRHRVHGEHGWDLDDLHGTRRRYRLLRRALQPVRVAVHHGLARPVRLARARAGRARGDASPRSTTASTPTIFRPPNGARERCPHRPASPARTPIVLGSVGRMTGIKDPLSFARAFVELLASEPDAARAPAPRARRRRAGARERRSPACRGEAPPISHGSRAHAATSPRSCAPWT